MDLLERFIQKQMEPVSSKKPKKRKGSTKKEKASDDKKSGGRLFYILEWRSDSGYHYTVHDRIYHNAWSSTDSEDRAKELLMMWLKRCPTQQKLRKVLHSIAVSDYSGYITAIMQRADDPEGYAARYRNKDKGGSGKPPRFYDYVYEQVRRYGICEDYVKGTSLRFVDLSSLQELLKQQRIKDIVREAKERKRKRLLDKIRQEKVKKKLKDKAAKADYDLQRKFGLLAGLFNK